MSVIADNNTPNIKYAQLMIRKDNLIRNITISEEDAERGFRMNDEFLGFKSYKKYTDYINKTIYDADEKFIQYLEFMYNAINVVNLVDWENVGDWEACNMTITKGKNGTVRIVYFHPR
ncbi:unnamed protein product [marine sediment metagenome]|uniref:Uncharacterized protein n=1 Tax=marine sediment metagenome TaxID=412755 RepID=X1AFS9_9ZZZZ